MKKQVTGFSFIEFVKLAQEAIVEGYRFDFEDNDSVPQRFGNTYEATMILEDNAVEVTQEPAVEVTQEPAVEVTEEPKTKSKRKPKEEVAE